MPDGVLAKDVKFLGVVQSYNEAKNFGLVASDEAHAMWGQEIYAFRDVLASCQAGVGDTIRFGIHVNTRGQPQVSLPVWKVDEYGSLLGTEDGAKIINAEEAVAQDPYFLDKLKEEVEGRSQQQNQKRDVMTGKMGGGPGAAWGPAAKKGKFGAKGGGDGGFEFGGKGMGKGKDMGKGKGKPGGACGGKGGPYGGGSVWGKGGLDATGGMGGMGGMEAFGGGMEAFGGGMGPSGEEVTLFVGGLPVGAEKREVAHIFRQYAGYMGMRIAPRADHCIAFVTFASQEQAAFVQEALTGYVFDEEAPPGMPTLQVMPAKTQSRQQF